MPAGRSVTRFAPILCSCEPTSGTARNTTPSSSSAICTMSVYVTAEQAARRDIKHDDHGRKDIAQPEIPGP